MKARTLGLMTIAVLSVALLTEADDAWKSKPYMEWSAQELQRILNNSPWARPVAGMSGGDTKVTESLGPVVNRKGESVSAIGDHKTAVTTPTTIYTDYVVLWLSSRTVREALARKMQLEGTATSQQAAQLAEHAPQTYVVVVSPGAYFFGDMAPEEIVKNAKTLAHLEMAQSKLQIPAMKVQFFTQAPLAGSLAFYFPRLDENGVPTIGPNETNMKFVCAAPKEKIKVTFDLKKMERDGKADLL